MTAGLAPLGDEAAGLRDLLGELGDLKRIRSAGRDGSIAARAFRRAWAALVSGVAPRDVMRTSAGAALTAARLGDLDFDKLRELGIGSQDATEILCRAFDEVAGHLDGGLANELRGALDRDLPSEGAPAFVDDLTAQPRAGATCPGRPRLVLEPAESHAEHCWAVAIFGVCLSPRYGADPTTVFLAGLSHHLHNAAMPDSGFTGEMLLGAHLQPACDAAMARALAQLPDALRQEIAAARRILPDASTAEGRAFHAADVVDRVMQLAQHLRGAGLTMRALLDEWELVHAGPVKAFHDAVLVEMRLA